MRTISESNEESKLQLVAPTFRTSKLRLSSSIHNNNNNNNTDDKNNNCN